MYLGKLVELADAKTIYTDPLMPYHEGPDSAAPVPDPKWKRYAGELCPGRRASPINPPSGCRFHTRCPYMIEACKQVEPPLIEIKLAHFAPASASALSSRTLTRWCQTTLGTRRGAVSRRHRVNWLAAFRSAHCQALKHCRQLFDQLAQRAIARA